MQNGMFLFYFFKVDGLCPVKLVIYALYIPQDVSGFSKGIDENLLNIAKTPSYNRIIADLEGDIFIIKYLFCIVIQFDQNT